jgi:hypothetical protein
MVIKTLGTSRGFYNFVEAGKYNDAPAMRLGLAKGSVDTEDIIYYTA